MKTTMRQLLDIKYYLTKNIFNNFDIFCYDFGTKGESIFKGVMCWISIQTKVTQKRIPNHFDYIPNNIAS